MWINLPVKDIAASKEFFKKIGFESNPRHENNPNLASFFIGKEKTVMMLFPEAQFSGFCGGTPVSDTSKGCEILLNLGADSKEQVDEMAALVKAAGGKVFGEPSEAQGWMYAFGFADPDGHRWSMLYMDMAKMPQ